MLEETVVITNKVGLHARPAALLVKAASGFAADVAIAKGEKVFNAKSILAIMGAAVRQGDTVVVRTSGADEAAAMAAVAALIRSGFGEE
ncbi:MAG: HPr family phosphocarrier protein [Negativicutes bacterium]|nr:HPr family phosphocarrier protein [Negativicutes bacterium]